MSGDGTTGTATPESNGVIDLLLKRKTLEAVRALKLPDGNDVIWKHAAETLRQIDEDLLRLDTVLRQQQRDHQRRSGQHGRRMQMHA